MEKKEIIEMTDAKGLSGFKLLIEEILKETNIKYSQLECEMVKHFGNSCYVFFRINGTMHLLKIIEKNVSEKMSNGLVKVEIEYVIRELIDILLERSTKVASGKAELFM